MKIVVHLALTVALIGLTACAATVPDPSDRSKAISTDLGSGVTHLALPGASYLEIEGEIGYAMSVEILKAESKDPDLVGIIIAESPGGEITWAQNIGNHLTAQALSVHVEGDCASACVDLVVGGHYRTAIPEARFGLHSADWSQDLTDELDRQYYQRHNALQVLLVAETIPNSQMLWLDAKTALQAGIIDSILKID